MPDKRKKKLDLSQIPRPPGLSPEDQRAMAAGQNKDVILQRSAARQRGHQARRKARRPR
jgi:hypothetical protein